MPPLASSSHQLTVQRRHPIYPYSDAPIACPGLVGDIEGHKGFILALSLPSKCSSVASRATRALDWSTDPVVQVAYSVLSA